MFFRRYVRRYRFNPRAPCGARPMRSPQFFLTCLFQSTRPVRGATVLFFDFPLSVGVSIHAPRAGRDHGRRCSPPYHRGFNPRAPCGARLVVVGIQGIAIAFQSTRPVRGATAAKQGYVSRVRVSIHAPRAGRDRVENVHEGASSVSIHAPRAGRDFYCSFVF